MEKLDREIIEKYNNRLCMIIILMLVFVWVGFEIFFAIHRRSMIEYQNWRDAQFKMRQEALEHKLQYLQEKYKEEIKEEERIKNLHIDYAKLNYEDIELLAFNNYFESRGVGKKDWSAKRKDMENVSSVVLNRLQSGKYGKTIREVLQSAKIKKNGVIICQFSWVCQPQKPKINYTSEEWLLAYNVAYEVYVGITKRTASRAMHYYNPKKVQPRWAKKAKEVAYVSGGHRIIIID